MDQVPQILFELDYMDILVLATSNILERVLCVYEIHHRRCLFLNTDVFHIAFTCSISNVKMFSHVVRFAIINNITIKQGRLREIIKVGINTSVCHL